jgi:hypothetical protein
MDESCAPPGAGLRTRLEQRSKRGTPEDMRETCTKTHAPRHACLPPPQHGVSCTTQLPKAPTAAFACEPAQSEAARVSPRRHGGCVHAPSTAQHRRHPDHPRAPPSARTALTPPLPSLRATGIRACACACIRHHKLMECPQALPSRRVCVRACAGKVQIRQKACRLPLPRWPCCVRGSSEPTV